jgi:hypothetical protein
VAAAGAASTASSDASTSDASTALLVHLRARLEFVTPVTFVRRDQEYAGFATPVTPSPKRGRRAEKG